MSDPLGDGGVMEGLSACECPICFLILSERRLPMSMPCGHTLCKVCIDQLARQSTAQASALGRQPRPTFPCPLCREWVNIDSVMLNVTLRDLIAELTSKKPLQGTTLNVNYSDIEFGEPLDRGAFGEVYRGKWRGNEVAVKLFTSGQLTPEAMQAFQREVFVMNCLRHPNVVLLMGACQTPPRLAILMEFAAGGSLHQAIHVDKQRLSMPQIQVLAVDVCRGLQYLHSINILHRDLKSKNVLLTSPLPQPHCQAKLCDFGLARMRLESATMTGNVGTVHWTAPEILNNLRYQFPADIYSFGMVLFEMVCGRIPFQNVIPMAVMLAVAVRREQPQIPSSTHPKLSALIRRCIQWSPESRPSIPQVLSALQDPELAPPTQNIRPNRQLQHQDSLGVVFLSATDSADLNVQDNDGLHEALRMLSGEEEKEEGGGEDFKIALAMQEEERQRQLLHDSELAEQMQLRENTFLVPQDQQPKSSSLHPLSLLTAIKSKPELRPITKEEAPFKKVSKKKTTAPSTTPLSSKKMPPSTAPLSSKKMPPSTAPLSSKKMPPSNTGTVASEESKVRKAFSKITPKVVLPSKTASKASPLMAKPKVKEQMKSSALTPSPHAPAPQKMKTKRAPPLLQKKSGAKPPPSPPPPPPLPTPPPSHWSPRQHLLHHVRRAAPSIARKLRHVETVEKRAFRVGRVVDGYNGELEHYSLTNLVTSFSRRRLRHVAVEEPPPAFPIGRVVRSNPNVKVKRLSSMIDVQPSPIPPPPPPPPPPVPKRRLTPAIRAAIEKFSKSNLQHVEPLVKDTLPDSGTIALEKEVDEEERLHTAIQEDVEHFDPSSLQHVTPVVRNTLPDISSEYDVMVKEQEETQKRAEKENKKMKDMLWAATVIQSSWMIYRWRKMEMAATLIQSSWRVYHWRKMEQQQGKKAIALEKLVTLKEEEREKEVVRHLHPAIRSELIHFDNSLLHHVTPVVKNTLPDMQTIYQERAEGLGPVTQERAEGLGPVTQERAEGLGPVTQERAEGLGPVTQERAEGLGPVTQERAEGLGPVTQWALEEPDRLIPSERESEVPVDEEEVHKMEERGHEPDPVPVDEEEVHKMEESPPVEGFW